MAEKKTDSKIIQWEEFIKHSSFESCWVLIGGKVYDVTEYKRHPGSFDILVGSSKKDATHSFDTVNHSPSAIKMLQRFYIGDIDLKTLPNLDMSLNGHGVENWYLYALVMITIIISLRQMILT